MNINAMMANSTAMSTPAVPSPTTPSLFALPTIDEHGAGAPSVGSGVDSATAYPQPGAAPGGSVRHMAVGSNGVSAVTVAAAAATPPGVDDGEREAGGWLARVPPSVSASTASHLQGEMTKLSTLGTPHAIADHQPRMPWHDVAVALGPAAAVDIATHFIQVRWGVGTRLACLCACECVCVSVSV